MICKLLKNFVKCVQDAFCDTILSPLLAGGTFNVRSVALEIYSS